MPNFWGNVNSVRASCCIRSFKGCTVPSGQQRGNTHLVFTTNRDEGFDFLNGKWPSMILMYLTQIALTSLFALASFSREGGGVSEEEGKTVLEKNNYRWMCL